MTDKAVVKWPIMQISTLLFSFYTLSDLGDLSNLNIHLQTSG